MDGSVCGRGLRVARKPETTTRYSASNQRIKSWFNEWDSTCSEALQTLFAQVNSQDVMANLCEACGCDEPNITCAVDNNTHVRWSFSIIGVPRGLLRQDQD
jgi:hypothetical protein